MPDSEELHGVTPEDVIQLPLNKWEFHYIQHCVAFYEAVIDGDLKTATLVTKLISENSVHQDREAYNALAQRMNAISIAVFTDYYFYRGKP